MEELDTDADTGHFQCSTPVNNAIIYISDHISRPKGELTTSSIDNFLMTLQKQAHLICRVDFSFMIQQ